MNIYVRIILVLLLLYILYVVQKGKLETFIDTGPRNVKFDRFGYIDYVDRMPPSWRGERSCLEFPCPRSFDKNTICWKCLSIQDEPQND